MANQDPAATAMALRQLIADHSAQTLALRDQQLAALDRLLSRRVAPVNPAVGVNEELAANGSWERCRLIRPPMCASSTHHDADSSVMWLGRNFAQTVSCASGPSGGKLAAEVAR